MISQIRILFVGAPSRTSIENQKLLASNCLPLHGHFEESIYDAIDHLNNCAKSRFPEVIILDEKLGEAEINKMIRTFRHEFHKRHIDTLIFVSGSGTSLMKIYNGKPLVSGYIDQPLNKRIFLEQIYPLMFVTLV